MKQVFEGIKVAEFAAIAAGPLIGKFMADHGATVVHVESFARPDGFRSNYPPFKDNEPGLDRSGRARRVTDSYILLPWSVPV